jgi:prolyl-tRNA synthetase
MFSDMELIGVPHRIVLGDRGLDSNTAEYRARTDSENQDIALDSIVDFITTKLAN